MFSGALLIELRLICVDLRRKAKSVGRLTLEARFYCQGVGLPFDMSGSEWRVAEG